MILRLIIENFLSLRDLTEFNTFPAGIKNKSNHKGEVQGVEFLKAAAIYGANGSGKSNLIEAISYLKETIELGKLSSRNMRYRLDKKFFLEKPSKIEIEFLIFDSIYYYELEFQNNTILKEILWKDSNKKKSILIFERILDNSKIKIELGENFKPTEKDRMWVTFLEEEVIKNNTLVISSNKIHKILSDTSLVFEWFCDALVVISPESHVAGLPERLFKEQKFHDYIEKTLCALDTGISGLNTRKIILEDFFGEDDKEKVNDLKTKVDEYIERKGDGVLNVKTNAGDVNIEKIEDEYFVYKVELTHHGISREGDDFLKFDIPNESDGTQRLLDLLPMTFGLKNQYNVFVVDEIERSLHPVLIKELISKVLSEEVKGQLIFTTHESTLLDLDIFRQDEIWFTEKNTEGATKLYPLSDFKPRFDLDIRKGYLAGRFGAIPFLGNLKGLKWDLINEK